MYILEKYSHPGWKLEADEITTIVWMLEKHVCKKCKWTKEQYIKHGSRENFDEFDEADMIADNMNPYTFTDFFPENYSELTHKEKIILLLNTACGCEYGYEEKEAE